MTSSDMAQHGPGDGLDAPESASDPENGTRERRTPPQGAREGIQGQDVPRSVPRCGGSFSIPELTAAECCNCGDPLEPCPDGCGKTYCFGCDDIEQLHADDAPSPTCLRPDTCHPGDPCSPCLANGQHPAADDTGLEPYYSAIEERIYQLRERTCQWDETDGTTQEIARQAAIAAKDAAVEEWNPVCGRVAMGHQEVIDRLRRHIAEVHQLHKLTPIDGDRLECSCGNSLPCPTREAIKAPEDRADGPTP